MRLALHLHRGPRLTDRVPEPSEVLAMGTTGGARLLGQADKLGRLAEGMAADLAVVNLSRASWPYRAPEAEPIAFIVQRAKAGDVTDVLVDGCHVLQAGLPTRFDWPALGERLGEQFRATPPNHSGVQLAKELRPFVEAWYSAWHEELEGAAALQPYNAMNSRL